MPFPTEDFTLPPREHKKVNYAEFEAFSDSSSENNKKQNHGNYISWTSSEDAILIEQVQKFIESQKLQSTTTNNEKEINILNSNNPISKLGNNENNLNLNKEKNLLEKENKIKLEEKEVPEEKINAQNKTNEPKISPLANINWSKIAEKLENKNARQCQTRWQNILDPNRVKGPWTKEEDMKLIELVNKFGPEKWSNISSYLPGRLGKQCRERWYNHLDPEVRKTGWSKEEEWVLFLLHRKYGNSWSTFSEKIPGRTDNTIKNHWNSIMKKNIVGINNQYQEMIKGKTKEEIEEIEKNIMDKCNQVIYKDYNDYYQEKLKAFPNMKLSRHAKKDKERNKENENNLNNNDNKNNNIMKSNSLDSIINNIDIKTPIKIKKKIFENIKISDKDKKKSTPSKSKSKNRKISTKKEDIKEKKQKYISESKDKKKQSSLKKRSKYFNINDDKELKILKSGEKVLQNDKYILIKEAENKFKEKQKLKKTEKKNKAISNSKNKIEEEEIINKKAEKLHAYSNKKTAKKGKKRTSKNKNANSKKKKAKFNVSKLSNRKEKDSPNINNLNNMKLNMSNNYLNNSNNMNNNFNSEFMSNNINIPYPTFPEKYPYYNMDEERDFTKFNLNKILITDSKDINKSKKEQQFAFKFPPTTPFFHSEIKNSSESSGGNNSLGKITPDFRPNLPFNPSIDKFYYPNPQNVPQNRGIFFNNNPKIIRFTGGRENNNHNNKISTDSNSIRSYSMNNSMLSAHSAFKKSSSGSGSGSGKSFPVTVGAFNFHNMADLNKEYFSNITLDEKNLNKKI